MYLIILTIVANLVSTGICYGDNDTITIGQLPTAIRGEIVNILNGGLKLVGQCPDPQQHDFTLLLYKRNVSDPISLDWTTIFEIDPNKPIKLLIHGWLTGVSAMTDIKDAYLNRYDCNVIIVNWSSISYQLYTTAFCELPELGRLLGIRLCGLFEEIGISLENLHIVGHSLGAHLAGFAGDYVRNNCKQPIRRITGLDPAGPLYQGLPKSDRLDSSDAQFVDVIHTNELGFGYWGNIGDVDFHVNCGYYQVGCPVIRLPYISRTLQSIIFCSHTKSKSYMRESIWNDTFVGQSCDFCPVLCVGGLFSTPSYVIMGEDCPQNPPQRVYWLPTAPAYPYSLGCTPYGPKCSHTLS